MKPTQEQARELERLATYFPYRIVWLGLSPQGECEFHADYSKRRMNHRLRKGWEVYRLQ